MLLGQLGMPGRHLLGNLARHLDQVGVYLQGWSVVGGSSSDQKFVGPLIGKTADPRAWPTRRVPSELLRVESTCTSSTAITKYSRGRSRSKRTSIAEEGRTMLVVTHEKGFAREVSNHVIFVHQGRVEEEGDPREVLTKPTSERLQQFLSGSLK
jgi:histidine transport system ATP-binding protein